MFCLPLSALCMAGDLACGASICATPVGGMEAPAGVNRILMVSGAGTRRSRKCSFNIRVKNAEQRAGIP
ncbi:hypothetical protein NE913_003429 [Salmonella enterica]|nr:hypothetical protein [Salmonella enterica]